MPKKRKPKDTSKLSRAEHKPVIGHVVVRTLNGIRSYWTGRDWSLHPSDAYKYARKSKADSVRKRRESVQRQHAAKCSYETTAIFAVKQIRRGDV